MSEWISVKDRLPKDQQNILALSNNLGHSQGEMNIISVIFDEGKFIIDHFCESSYIDDVEYWMPLPNYPEDLK